MDVSHSSGTTASPSTPSSSSKSGSIKSKRSVENDRDLTKDNAATPIDLECQIQAERIKKILDEAVSKTKLALCLPTLVKEYKTLQSTLSAEHMEDLIFIFEQYENPLFSSSFLNLEAMEDIKMGNVSLKNRLNPELGHLLYIMNSYAALTPKVNEIVEQMRIEYSDEDGKPHPGLEYLLALEEFREMMLKQIATTAAEELASKFNNRRLEACNLKLSEKIDEYTNCLKEEQSRFEDMMTAKYQTIARLEHEMLLLKCDANIKLKKQILDSERQMVLATRTHTVQLDMLKEEEAEFKACYENLLNEDLKEEKSQRARRFKLETQLRSWLQKYDAEMTDKQIEFDDLTELYEEEIRKTEECELKLAEQDKQYVPLMAEREEEYHQEMLRKMQDFLQIHAARIIQHAWRQVLANRAEKKKLFVLIKKMEVAKRAAAAAAAAEEARLAKEAKINKTSKRTEPLPE